MSGAPEDEKASRDSAQGPSIRSADDEAKARARTYLVPSRMERENMNYVASGSGEILLVSRKEEEEAEERTEPKSADDKTVNKEEHKLASEAPGAQAVGGLTAAMEPSWLR